MNLRIKWLVITLLLAGFGSISLPSNVFAARTLADTFEESLEGRLVLRNAPKLFLPLSPRADQLIRSGLRETPQTNIEFEILEKGQARVTSLATWTTELRRADAKSMIDVRGNRIVLYSSKKSFREPGILTLRYSLLLGALAWQGLAFAKHRLSPNCRLALADIPKTKSAKKTSKPKFLSLKMRRGFLSFLGLLAAQSIIMDPLADRVTLASERNLLEKQAKENIASLQDLGENSSRWNNLQSEHALFETLQSFDELALRTDLRSETQPLDGLNFLERQVFKRAVGDSKNYNFEELIESIRNERRRQLRILEETGYFSDELNSVLVSNNEDLQGYQQKRKQASVRAHPYSLPLRERLETLGAEQELYDLYIQAYQSGYFQAALHLYQTKIKEILSSKLKRSFSHPQDPRTSKEAYETFIAGKLPPSYRATQLAKLGWIESLRFSHPALETAWDSTKKRLALGEKGLMDELVEEHWLQAKAQLELSYAQRGLGFAVE